MYPPYSGHLVRENVILVQLRSANTENGLLLLLSLSITALGPCYYYDYIYVISVPCGKCTQNGDVAPAVLMHGMWFEH